MGFRFRKSFSLMPGVRMTVGKKGASVSVGNKGGRATISTTGRHTTSIGIPGTGLSYVSTSSKKKSKPKKQTVESPSPQQTTPREVKQQTDPQNEVWVMNDSQQDPIMYDASKNQKPKKPFYKRGWFIAIVVILVLGLLGTPTEEEQEAPDTTVTVQEDPSKATEEVIEETEPPTEAPTESVIETEPPAEPTVYISQTGSKYHRSSSCSNMESPSEVPLSTAEGMGLGPCGKCY